MLFDGATVGGRIPVSRNDGRAQQQRTRRPGGGGGETDGQRQKTGIGREEAAFPVGQGTEGVHHSGHNHERVHRVLAAVFRAGASQAVPQRPVQHTELVEQFVPVAGLRKLSTEPRESRTRRSKRFFRSTF